MLGRYDDTALAAAGIGNALLFAIVSVGLGIVMGLDTVVPQAIGAGRKDDARRALSGGLRLAILVGLAGTLVVLATPSILSVAGVPAEGRQRCPGLCLPSRGRHRAVPGLDRAAVVSRRAQPDPTAGARRLDRQCGQRAARSWPESSASGRFLRSACSAPRPRPSACRSRSSRCTPPPCVASKATRRGPPRPVATLPRSFATAFRSAVSCSQRSASSASPRCSPRTWARCRPPRTRSRSTSRASRSRSRSASARPPACGSVMRIGAGNLPLARSRGMLGLKIGLAVMSCFANRARRRPELRREPVHLQTRGDHRDDPAASRSPRCSSSPTAPRRSPRAPCVGSAIRAPRSSAT